MSYWITTDSMKEPQGPYSEAQLREMRLSPDAQCWSEQSQAWQPIASILPNPTTPTLKMRPKSAIPILPVFSLLSLAAVVAVGTLWLYPPGKPTRHPGSRTPKELIQQIYEFNGTINTVTVDSDFWQQSHPEILKTFEVVELFQNDPVALALVRYSVGSKIFREAFWIRKVSNDRWSFDPSISRYSDNKWIKENKEWFGKMSEKEASWEKESASKW